MFDWVCVDFDRTLVPWDSIWAFSKPYPGVIDAMKELKSQGYKIYILTSRMSDQWIEEAYATNNYNSPEGFKADQLTHIKTILETYEIPYDVIGAEKIPALVYFDDLAVRVNEEYPLPAAIYDFLEGQSSEGRYEGVR